MAEAQRVFGHDPWPYGIEANRRTLDAFLQFAHEQGVTSRRVQVDELFPRQLTAFSKT
jgi:4,5-dihydroxyphthalate decarboxylase